MEEITEAMETIDLTVIGTGSALASRRGSAASRRGSNGSVGSSSNKTRPNSGTTIRRNSKSSESSKTSERSKACEQSQASAKSQISEQSQASANSKSSKMSQDNAKSYSINESSNKSSEKSKISGHSEGKEQTPEKTTVKESQKESENMPNNKNAINENRQHKVSESSNSEANVEPASTKSPIRQPMRRTSLNFNATQECRPATSFIATATEEEDIIEQYPHTTLVKKPAMSPLKLGNSCTQPPQRCYVDKATDYSPTRVVNATTSPIKSHSVFTREHALKHDIDLLQERLKDTEERLQSLRIQHDSLSQLHRDLRENNSRLQEESEILKLDVQHLNECANVLRSELQSARNDRNEALELQKALQTELEESRQEKKRLTEEKDKDGKTIKDLQRQCKEMERILMRKHPDSVSTLIAVSNKGSKSNADTNCRKLLEERIAQLEADAKEQDLKAQKILANVQARFNCVQAKYETHIADLETQVLSLQEINTKLNEKIESQVRTLDYFVSKKADKYYNNCTQTEQIMEEHKEHNEPEPAKPISSHTATQTAKVHLRDHSTNTIATTNVHSASSSTSSTANSTPNNSRPNSKQSGLRKPTPLGTLTGTLASKLPVSRSDSTISLTTSTKEDAHLLATIRGMRADLALKDKAMQRLSRELEECKKTMRKLQRDSSKAADKPHTGPSGTIRYMSHDQKPAFTENQALKEAQNKIKLLEADYKQLHEKRLQDLKTLQSAHEREMTTCQETLRILQQRLSERDEAGQKRRKLPVDYYALKAKVDRPCHIHHHHH